MDYGDTLKGGVDVFTPTCADSLKPSKGMCFATWEEGVEFYRNYGRAGGFDIRMASAKKVDETITWKYIVCNREGEKFIPKDENKGVVVDEKRRRISTRCGCKARMVLKFEAQVGYRVIYFCEEHNHTLVEQQYKKFMKVNRNIDIVHQRFILDCAKASIGPTHSYKLLMEVLGGYDGVGCSVVDVRNFSRDMKAFVEGSDAQMLLNEMRRKKEACDAFVYEYELDREDRLAKLFWCDPISRRNYHMFGDVVAFDVTYSTNKYCMIFAPFTGMDNHGRAVTFASGLLSKEDAASFSWLFEKFVSSMGSPPTLIITDQDLGMKVAVEWVLVGTRHRWCMWHIMLKLADKVPKELLSGESFKKELNSCVWSELIEPEVFEDSWGSIMARFGLVGDPWFKTMYECRQKWVPAYFRDFRLSGLLRTTSISEGENSFYKRYTRCRSNLLQFWMDFNHALDAQRHNNSRLNYVDKTVVPKLSTKLAFEKQAAMILTSKMFSRVQEEIVASCFDCGIVEVGGPDDTHIFKIRDDFENTFDVVHDKIAETFVFDCKLFTRMGYLCRHIFCVFNSKRMKHIPDKYVIGRWQKIAYLIPVHDISSEDVQQYNDVDESHRIMKKLMSSMFGWIQRLEGDTNKMTRFLDGIDGVGRCITRVDSPMSVADKNKLFEEFYGAAVPDKIEVLPPNEVKTKGSGSRLESRKDKARKLLSKPLRRCATCKKMVRHDSRNCDQKK